MKSLLKELQKDIPHIKNSLLKALSNVHPRHLLDSGLYRKTVADAQSALPGPPSTAVPEPDSPPAKRLLRLYREG
jgi:hypothetical protein